MARSRRSKARRDAPHIANVHLTLPRVVLPRRPDLRIFEDRRTAYPARARQRPALLFSGRQHRLVVRDRKPTPRQSAFGFKPNDQTRARVAFADPRKTLVCVRRKVRKEVLHATGAAGSRRRQKKPRHNELSKISCR